MRSIARSVLIVGLLVSTACKAAPNQSSDRAVQAAPASQVPGSAAQRPPAEPRKVTKNASLVLDVTDIEAARRKAITLVEQRQGFVLNLVGGQNADEPTESIQLTVCVPVADFERVLGDLRNLAQTVRDERTNAQDVTGNYVDLTARLIAKRKLEERVLALLSNAKTIKEALEVERELSAIRTEVEQLEGARNLLESQAALSTIHITLQRAQARVLTSVSTIRASLDRAYVDSLNISGAILTTTIRALGVIVPVALMFGGAAFFGLTIVRSLRRRAQALAAAKR